VRMTFSAYGICSTNMACHIPASRLLGNGPAPVLPEHPKGTRART
jgi:hypothetical protein